MCNLSKHALVAFLVGAFADGELKGSTPEPPGNVEFIDPLYLNPVKNEIPYMRVPLDANPQHKIEITPFPLLEYRGLQSRDPAVDVLASMIEEADRIVIAIERECRRIGLIT
jgi:hypothetical protein